MSFFLLLPFIASLVYVIGALLLKASAHHRASIWKIAWITNVALAICGIPLWWGSHPEPIPWALIWQPIITGLFSLAGQATTYLALEKGDVSIATPVMGLKVLGVAIFSTTLTATQLPPLIWFAAILSAAAIALLQFRTGVHHRRVLLTILLSSISAICYALHDVLIQVWKANWGYWFLPMAYTTAAIISGIGWAILARRIDVPIVRAPRNVWIGACLIGAQGMLVVLSIALYGDPTSVNLVFNARGLWSVLAIMLIGHWFGISEQALDRSMLLRRLAGAVLMLSAIVIAIVAQSQ